jgi:hypothetical protein
MNRGLWELRSSSDQEARYFASRPACRRLGLPLPENPPANFFLTAQLVDSLLAPSFLLLAVKSDLITRANRS